MSQALGVDLLGDERMNFFAGYKTYIIAALVGVATVMHQLGYVDADTYTTILGFLGAGGLAALRIGVSNG